jgi:hypothetical protein
MFGVHVNFFSLHGNVRKLVYSLGSILFFAKLNVSTTKICLDISILEKSNINRRE